MIPVSKPDLSGNEEKYVTDAIRSSWISSTGDFISRFEKEFANICEVPYAVSCCNGTTALHLALLALDVRPGDEVLVPALTYVAVANAVKYVGATPVLVDVHPTTWCIDAYQLEEKITPRTKGIIAVHLYGHPADMDAINKIAAIHGFWVIEDAAEAHFAQYKDQKVGGLARLSTFSFYGNKLITCGEGGAILTSDPQLDLRLRLLRGQGMDPEKRYYFPMVGYNFRLTNVAAAILCAQLEHKEVIWSQRQRIYSRYKENLSVLKDKVSFQPEASWAKITPWLFSILVDTYRFRVSDALSSAGIDTRPFFIPLNQLPMYKTEEKFPVSEKLAREGLNLPTYSSLSNEEIDKICEIISGVL